MKEYLRLQEFFLVLMIFILLIQLSGCLSYRVISSYELPNSSKYHYTIYSQNSKFPLENTVISNGILSGKVGSRHSSRRNSIHIYLTTDTVIKIDTENILSIPLNRIAKVEKAEVLIEKKPPSHKVKEPKTPFGKVILGLLYICVMVSLISILMKK
jgi:hypothetical protein